MNALHVDEAAGRLRTLIDACAERPELGPDLWREYVPHLADDARWLAAAPEVEGWIAEVRALEARGSTAWSADLRRAVTRARNLARRVPLSVVRPDEEVADGGDGRPELAVWKALDITPGEQPKVKRHIDNAGVILEADSRLRGRVRQNDFALCIEVDGERVEDRQITALRRWMIQHYGVAFGKQDVIDVLADVAADHAYHPVRDYLNGVRWDREPRISCLLPRYFATEDSPLVRAFGLRFMIGCVARVMEPGCKLDTMLILQGAQGARKSSGLRALFGADWFKDSRLDPDHKDFNTGIVGAWCFEIGEVEKWLDFRHISTIKAVLTSQVDDYRPSYGKFNVSQPRQVAFVGTTNQEEFLNDPTGSRRFWPVRCGDVDLEALAADRDQLWAEAVHLYDRRTQWHLTAAENALFDEHVSTFEIEDPVAGALLEWARERGDGFTTLDALQGALRLETAKANSGEGRRVSALLRRMGYKKTTPSSRCADRTPRWRKA